jgi:uncharacterized OB-fold protein
MTENASPATRPAPIPDEASQPFFDAAAEGKLLIKYCPACSRHLVPAADVCDACHSTGIEWRQASGRATLYSFVVNHQVLHPGFANEVPYNVLVVELEEGPRINGNYLGDNADLKVDMALKVTFEKMGDVSVPKWVAG